MQLLEIQKLGLELKISSVVSLVIIIKMHSCEQSNIYPVDAGVVGV